MKFRYLFFLFLAILTAQCTSVPVTEEDKVAAAAETFGDAYFNWRFEQASRMATSDSEKWLRFAASQVTQSDVDLLNSREGGCLCEVEQVVLDSIGSEAEAVINVTSFLDMSASHRDEQSFTNATFILKLVKESDQWKVRMEGPLRSERQSRD